ncbi:MAG: hypothetical protein Ct9H300mP32_3150 [Verrucomicrobiota bacterium]|nr:MAG: hypothetical protein Ct9H300mP32_3150 [Verrucomicrobiota bacterium]
MTFNRQSKAVSEGRFPNGADTYARFPTLRTPGAPNLLDLNLNGLPDDWENAYGLLPDDTDDALYDTDGDGLTNLAEYFAGTDPTDSASHLALESITVTGDTVP